MPEIQTATEIVFGVCWQRQLHQWTAFPACYKKSPSLVPLEFACKLVFLLHAQENRPGLDARCRRRALHGKAFFSSKTGAGAV